MNDTIKRLFTGAFTIDITNRYKDKIDELSKQLVDYYKKNEKATIKIEGYINWIKQNDYYDKLNYEGFEMYLNNPVQQGHTVIIEKKKTNFKPIVAAVLIPSGISLVLIALIVISLIILSVIVFVFTIIGLVFVGIIIAIVWLIVGFIIYRVGRIHKSISNMIIYTILGPFSLFYQK